jgi:SHS2 domain-containing protein
MGASFRLEPHTADIRLVLTAETLPELFQIAVIALAEILLPGECHARRRLPLRRSVAREAPDTTALLVDFLSDVLWHSQVGKALFCRVSLTQLTPRGLQAQLRGVRVERFMQDVKAVTYHEAEVRRHSDGYEARLVLDV